MLKKAIFCLSLLATASSAYANEAIAYKDEFEGQYVQCIEDKLDSDCWNKVFSGHFDNWQLKEKDLISKSQTALSTWIGKHDIYKVHLSPKETKGEVFENRAYLIERDDGQLMGLHIGFRQIKGQWYVYELMTDTDDAFIRAILNMPKIK
ncbi:hypothetical protein HX870_30785 [Pseudomonas gingeri]|uniref:hypothetical protein n=1 Tax=Pseudomonas gingeri TaxID=117681 RepID=UPI0015A1D4B3|nr:hypothetical protein [Pseudomonas gingeri]NWA25171.1 hypothetical protein [Pseudomonas gingeri]NWD72002.1 hypothetical protein [Pseudomonas gingeri]